LKPFGGFTFYPFKQKGAVLVCLLPRYCRKPLWWCSKDGRQMDWRASKGLN